MSNTNKSDKRRKQNSSSNAAIPIDNNPMDNPLHPLNPMSSVWDSGSSSDSGSGSSSSWDSGSSSDCGSCGGSD